MEASLAISEPIAALATPYGKSALCIIRLSGDNAIGLLKKSFSAPHKLNKHGQAAYGFFLGPGGEKIDETLVLPFFGPKSYTGEDVAEIYAHGNMGLAKQILQVLFQNGFREAYPGEFTYRAYILGKMDLIEAEAVHDIISAGSAAAGQAALQRLRGALSKEITAVYEKTLLIEAALHARLDYTEDEADAHVLQDFCADNEIAQLKRLLEEAETARLIQEGALIAIAGRPNTGKSLLFNRFLKEDRSIVSSTAGATRDYIEANIEINGLLCRIADTAGLRKSHDPLERAGIEKSLALMERADVILYLIDASDPEQDPQAGRYKQKTIIVANKCDIAEPPCGCLAVSAKTGSGFEALCQEISCIVDPYQTASRSERLMIQGERQKRLCQRALVGLEFYKNCCQSAPLDELSLHIGRSVEALAQLLGRQAQEDALQTMFSSFCLGK